MLPPSLSVDGVSLGAPQLENQRIGELVLPLTKIRGYSYPRLPNGPNGSSHHLPVSQIPFPIVSNPSLFPALPSRLCFPPRKNRLLWFETRSPGRQRHAPHPRVIPGLRVLHRSCVCVPRENLSDSIPQLAPSAHGPRLWGNWKLTGTRTRGSQPESRPSLIAITGLGLSKLVSRGLSSQAVVGRRLSCHLGTPAVREWRDRRNNEPWARRPSCRS